MSTATRGEDCSLYHSRYYKPAYSSSYVIWKAGLVDSLKPRSRWFKIVVRLVLCNSCMYSMSPWSLSWLLSPEMWSSYRRRKYIYQAIEMLIVLYKLVASCSVYMYLLYATQAAWKVMGGTGLMGAFNLYSNFSSFEDRVKGNVSAYYYFYWFL